MQKQSKFAIERLVPDMLPWYHKQMYFDHIRRYEFASEFVKNKQVLDVACGTGYGSLLLAKSAARRVFGIDISKKTIKYAQKHYPHKKLKFVVGDATDIPLANNSVDVVVCFETLEHVKKYRKLLDEVKRVLRKNGLLVISTPNKLLSNRGDNPYHVREFGEKEFGDILENNFSDVKIYGQKPVYLRYINFAKKITSSISNDFLFWIVDTIFKSVFRGSKVKPISTYKKGFVPSYVIGLAKVKQ